MKKLLQKLRAVKGAVVVTVTAAVSSVAMQANAALPAWATDIGTDISTAVTDVATAVGPVVVLSLVTFITIKLIKRGANKI